MLAQLEAVERGEAVEESDAGVLAVYQRGEHRSALVTGRRVVCGDEGELRRLL